MAGAAKYAILLHWSEADQSYVAEVPELPGCAACGPTYQQAVTNVEAVIAEWIGAAEGLGRAVPPPWGRPLYS